MVRKPWKGYLATFPNGPQSADTQRAILDTQLLVAADHLNRARYPEAPRLGASSSLRILSTHECQESSFKSARVSWPRRNSTRP